MKTLVRPISFLALVLTLVAPVLFALGRMSEPTMKHILLAGAVLWFASAPLWMHGSGDD